MLSRPVTKFLSLRLGCWMPRSSVYRDHVEIAVVPGGEIRLHHDPLWVDPLLFRLECPPAHIPCKQLPSAAPIRACRLNSLIRNKPCVESQSYYIDGVMNCAIHPGCPRDTTNMGIISPLCWSPWFILASYYRWNVCWLAVDDPHTSNNVNGIHTMYPDQVTPSWLQGSGVYLLLSDLRLPTLGQRLWTEASPLQDAVECCPPRQLEKPSNDWTSSILPWNHALYGGFFAMFGKLHLVTRKIEDWDTSWSFPRLP
jgi:hypothetical protein